MNKFYALASLLVIFSSNAIAQTFTAESLQIPKDYWSEIQWIDMNGDGEMDVFETGFGGGAMIHFKSGNTFTSKQVSIPTVYFVNGSYDLKDYDFDGDIDILLSGPNSLSIATHDGNGNFLVTPTDISFGIYQAGPVAWQDVDGDADLDISQGHFLYLNTNGSYQLSINKLPNTLSRLVWGDLNNDGLIDLISVESYTVGIYLNQGDGIYSSRTDLALNVCSTCAFELVDADNDHDLDIFAADSQSGQGLILRNDSHDQFSVVFNTQGFYAPATSQVAFGDLNEDGFADFVLSGYIDGTPSIQIYTNNASAGAISFTAGSSFTGNDIYTSLALVDYDNDGHLDIFHKGYTAGDNTFINEVLVNQSTTPLPLLEIPSGLTSATGKNIELSWTASQSHFFNVELKRDGKIFRTSATTPASGKLLSGGKSPLLVNSNSTTFQNLPAGTYQWRVQSVDQSRRTSAFSGAATFTIINAPDNLTVQPLTLTSARLCWDPGNIQSSFAIFRRANNAGAKEIAVVPPGTNCYVDQGLEEETVFEYYVKAVLPGQYSAASNVVTYHSSRFVERPFGSYSPNIISARCLPADFDLDGDYDLEFMGRVDYSSSDAFLKNDGTGDFRPSSILPEFTYDYGFNSVVDVLDLDGDGDTDVCVRIGSEYSRQKMAMLMNVNGKLVKGFETDPAFNYGQHAMRDFNNDGRVDLLYRHSNGNGPHVYELMWQKANGDFIDSKIRFTKGDYDDYGSFIPADLNDDGYQDIYFTGGDYQPARVFINEHGQAFREQATTIPSSHSIIFADVDADGITDFVMQNNDGIAWHKGDGAMGYSAAHQIPAGPFFNSISFQLADLDLNGWPDLLVTNGYYSFVVNNMGDGNFESSTATFKPDWGSALFVTDFENDGDLDLVKTGNDDQHQGYNYFYVNQLDRIGVTNARPTVPTGLAATYKDGDLNITWSPSTDDKTPSKLLTYNLWIKDSNGKSWLHPETNDTGLFRRRLANGNAGHLLGYNMRELPAGSYKIKVQAIDASFATSSWSSEISVSIAAGPTNLKAERILLNKVALSWTPSAFNETRVIIERKSLHSQYETVADLPAGTTTFTDSNLPYDSIYSYRVMEANASSFTATSNVAEWSTLMWAIRETDFPNLYGSIAIGDFTNDGKMDMMLNGGRIYNGQYAEIVRATFENNHGNWSRKDLAPFYHTGEIKLIDLNGDNKLDIYQHAYIWNTGYKTETLLNNGDKTFTATATLFSNKIYQIGSTYDFDKDNDEDLDVVDRVTSERKLLRNDGHGSYTTVQTSSCVTGFCENIVASADFDNDGYEDVITWIYNSGNYVLGMTSKSGAPYQILFPSYESSLSILDFNGDGLMDVALRVNSFYTKSKLYKNLGPLPDGTIAFELITDQLPAGESTLEAADFDHDGQQDIAWLAPGATVYRNTGNNTFKSYSIPRNRISLHHSGLIDLDDDGDLDIYLSGYVENDSLEGYDEPYSKIMVNRIIDEGKGIHNTPPAAPTNLTAVEDSVGMHLTWQTGVDDHTSSEAMTHDVILYRDGNAILKAAIDPATGNRLTVARGRFGKMATINNLKPGNYTWKVQAVDQSYAGSPLSVEGSFLYVPMPPLVRDTLIYSCGRSITITAVGENIKWYSDREKTQLVASGELHPTESQILFVTQTIDGYEGLVRRVSITIYEHPNVPIVAPTYDFCETAFNGNLQAQGEEIRWYLDAAKTNLAGTGNWLFISKAETSYFVTQTINGCESDPAEVKTRIVTIDANIYGEADKLTAGQMDADEYRWYRNGLYIQNSNHSSIPYSGERAAFYVYIRKGICYEYSRTYDFPDELVSAIEDDNDEVWTVYPNPSAGDVTIEIKPGRGGSLKIFDVSGRLVDTRKVDTAVISARYARGVYTIMFNDGKVVRQKRFVIY